ncbi:MAG TPA: hypothetical protein VEY09_13320 [Pyrinomonadaceae bacterium]|nr:hypothetical protein [Pyrinomonadaceae bacterium]
MKNLKRRYGLAPLFVAALVVMGGAAAFAQRQLAGGTAGRPEVKVALVGTVEREGKRLSLEEAGSVRPGELLDWRIVSENEGEGAARAYKAVGHIPPGTAFVAGSAAAEGGSTVTYSIDGGKTYSTLPLVEEKQPDGTVKRVPAPASMYTEVRYEWSDALAAGGKLSASYQVRVK